MTCQFLEIVCGVVPETFAEGSCRLDYPVRDPLWYSHAQHRLFGGLWRYINVLDLFPKNLRQCIRHVLYRDRLRSSEQIAFALVTIRREDRCNGFSDVSGVT